MPHSDNVSNIMQGPSVRGGSKTDCYVLFHVCCVSYLKNGFLLSSSLCFALKDLVNHQVALVE